MPRNTDPNNKPARRSLRKHLLTLEAKAFKEYESYETRCLEYKKKGEPVPEYLENLRRAEGSEWSAIYNALVSYYGDYEQVPWGEG